MIRRWQQLSLQLSSGLLLHLCLFAILFSRTEPLQKPKFQQLVPIQIALHNRPLAKLPASSNPGGSSKPTANKKKPDSNEKSSVASRNSQKSYTHLLPQSGELVVAKTSGSLKNTSEGSSAQHHFSKGLSGIDKQNLLRDGGTLAALFDVPLRLRRQGHRLKAYALIKADRQIAGGLEIEYLNGDAILRAVIYEALQNLNTQEVLRRLIPLLVEQRLRIEIITDPSPREQSELEASFSWDQSNLTVLKTPPPKRESGGLALPDHAAEVAKEWDKAALAKLHHSLAYRIPLRSRKL